jgi:hypothetical protein
MEMSNPIVMIYGFYKVTEIWPGLFVCKQVTVCPGHIWTTLYMHLPQQLQDGLV